MSEYVLEARGIEKSFPGVKALDKVDFAVRRGEVHALVGENGAGKSTLMMVLGGVFMLKKGVVVYSQKIGKYAQFGVVCALILSFFHAFFTRIGFPLHLILLWVSVALTLCALVFYAGQCVKQLKEKKQG